MTMTLGSVSERSQFDEFGRWGIGSSKSLRSISDFSFCPLLAQSSCGSRTTVSGLDADGLARIKYLARYALG